MRNETLLTWQHTTRAREGEKLPRWGVAAILPPGLPLPHVRRLHLHVDCLWRENKNGYRASRTPKLAALFDGMRQHERQFVAEARAKAKAEIEAAQKSLKDLEAAAK
ncbi:MAG TPA: hypothetical protein VFU09_02865 [Candidatus Udaeobacter sp.]|nr:hypothetical protein [Candidatus Udaeobacter sp.]